MSPIKTHSGTFSVLFIVAGSSCFTPAPLVPETVDFGLVDAIFVVDCRFTMPPGESIMATIDLIETKLGREMSLVNVHKPWVYKPSFRYIN